jgi:hypothetical protein
MGCSAVSCLVALALMLVVIPVFAQAPTSTILGVVKDSTGGTVGGATVTETNADTGISRTATTGDDGAYRFPALDVGNYQITVMKDGFQTAQRKGITLVVAQAAEINVVLQVGSTGQTVVVTEEAPLVQTQSSTVGGLVDEQQVTDLPLNGRNLVDLTLMQAGVTETTVFPALSMGSGFMTGATLSANGASPHSNAYLLDGANELSTMGGNNSSMIDTTLGVDGVKEYKVITNLPDASYGLVSGAQTVIVSKGGTNNWHGDAFDYLRNGSMDARNYFDALDNLNFNGDGTNKSLDYPGKRIPPFHRNNFGGSVGGPIKKDKFFFYAVFEGLEQTWGSTITTTTLPGGCFDQVSTDSTFHQITATSMANATGSSTYNGQATKTGCGGADITNTAILYNLNGAIFPGQYGIFPYPNANVDPSGNEFKAATYDYSFPYIEPTSEQYGQIRFDYNFSASDSMFARFTQDDSHQTANRSYAYQRDYLFGGEQFLTLSETHIFSPTVLNTARFAFSRNESQGQSTTSPSVANNLGIVEQPTQDWGGFTPGGGVTAIGFIAADGTYINNTYSYADDVFWTKGKHGLKFGVLFDMFRVPENGHFTNRGSIAFSNLANMDSGLYSSMSTLGGTLSPSQSRNFAYHTLGFYAQDDYRVTPRLTLNLGLRYEFTSIPSDLNGNNWQIQDVATAAATNATQGAVKSPMWGNNPSYHAISPRFGFAWDVFGDGKTALRGGGGIYYDLGNYGALLFQQACCEPPVDFFNTINNSNSTLTATLAQYPGTTVNFPLPIAYGSAPVTPTNPTGVVAVGVQGVQAPRNWSYHQNQPATYQWNLTIDRQLPGNEDLTVAYVGTRGTHLVELAEGNPTDILGYLPNGLPYYCYGGGVAGTAPSLNDQCPTTSTFPNKSNPGYGIVNQDSDGAESWYNGLQVNWTQRTKYGLQGGIAFTWSKLLDEGQGQQGADAGVSEDTYFPQVRQLDKGVAAFNAAANLRGNVIYHAPNINSDRFYAKPLKGWWFGTIVSVQSGYPFSPSIPDRSLSNNPTGAGSSSDRPNLDPSFNAATVITHNPSDWFNQSMYDLPLAGTLGNAPRYGLRGPDLIDVDASVNKDTKAKFLGEAGMIEARAEVFNIANHPNFGNPSATIDSLSSPAGQTCGTGTASATNFSTCQFGVTGGPTILGTAGAITSTSNRSRQIQLSLKVIF